MFGEYSREILRIDFAMDPQITNQYVNRAMPQLLRT